MLLRVFKVVSSTASQVSNFSIEYGETDFKHETEEWIVGVDSSLPFDRSDGLRTDADLLLKAIKNTIENIDRNLFEKIFGGHYVAFVINKQSNDVYVFRDVTGAKSAYYTESKDNLTLGTNMHEVAKYADTSTLSLNSAHHLMTIDYLFDGDTFYRDVTEFPMGSVSTSFGRQPLRVARRFALDLADSENNNNMEMNICSLRDGIFHAHAKRAGSDNVVLLSGGIDSSVMLCALREVVDRSRIRAITFRVKGTLEDETVYAASLAKHLGVEIERIEVDPNDLSLVENFESDIKKMNNPYFGRFIFGQFKGSPNQVYFAGQDTRLHTPDLNQLDKFAFSTITLQRGTVSGVLLNGISKLARPLISMGFPSSKKRWQRGVFRAMLALDMDKYLPRCFFKVDPENLLANGYNEGMINDVISRVRVPWRNAKNSRHLYNLIVAQKWGEQYTDDMRYMQDLGSINNTNIALPFYDINLARMSSTLPFNQASHQTLGRSQFSNRYAIVNKFLLRQAFRDELNESLLMRAKAVSRSQYLLFSGVIGKSITRELRLDLSRGNDSVIRSLGLNQLADRFFETAIYRQADEPFLTKVYWLGIIALLGRNQKIG